MARTTPAQGREADEGIRAVQVSRTHRQRCHSGVLSGAAHHRLVVKKRELDLVIHTPRTMGWYDAERGYPPDTNVRAPHTSQHLGMPIDDGRAYSLDHGLHRAGQFDRAHLAPDLDDGRLQQPAVDSWRPLV